MEELTELQKAGLERLGKKAQKKQYWYDQGKRSAYKVGRVDGAILSFSIMSGIGLAIIIAMKVMGY